MTRRSEPPSWIQQAGLLTSIPVVLLVGPALGYYLGTVLDARWPIAPWGMIVGIVLGASASVNVIIQLIRQSRGLNRHD